MLPLLEHLGDKEEKATRETLDALANRFNLTEDGKKGKMKGKNNKYVYYNIIKVVFAKIH